MNNSYPDVFKTNCAGAYWCDTPAKGCNINKIKSNKVVKKQKVVSESILAEDAENVLVNDNSTIHCLPYEAPTKVIGNNKVDFKTVNSHSWSNQRGYGNIVSATNDTCNNIHAKIKPWNRIEPAHSPYFTNADVKMAWRASKK